MTESEAKEKFAQLLLQEPGNLFAVALKVFPDDTKRALRAVTEWKDDPEIKSLQEKAQELPLPTKGEFSRVLWDKMQDRYTEPDVFAKIAKVYAEVRGFIEKPQIAVNTNVQTVTNKVMVIRESRTDEDWERKLLAQQTALTHAAG